MYYFLQPDIRRCDADTLSPHFPAPPLRVQGLWPCLSFLSRNPGPDPGAQYILPEMPDWDKACVSLVWNGRTITSTRRHPHILTLTCCSWSNRNPGKGSVWCLLLLLTEPGAHTRAMSHSSTGGQYIAAHDNDIDPLPIFTSLPSSEGAWQTSRISLRNIYFIFFFNFICKLMNVPSN